MKLIFDTFPELPGLDAARRQAIATGPIGPRAHADVVAATPTLHGLEVWPSPAQPAPLREAATIAFWNAERCKYLNSSIELLRAVNADVTLLCEMDRGMARSGQRHSTRELAKALGQGYIFAVEYVELGLGDARERAWHAGESNRDGLHGGAILSAHALKRPALIRLETAGGWFDGDRGERRVGGRIAIAATVSVCGVDIAVVSVHFESHGNPAERAIQMRVLLEAIDAYAPAAPVIIGGDFNTSSADRESLEDPASRAKLFAEDPQRLVNPAPYEPLFQVAGCHGYDWTACNTRDPTQRARPDGTPEPPFARLDWFFVRGLEALDPLTIPAVDTASQAISDHELLTVTIRPTTP